MGETNIITETKKISELPMVLGFSDTAVVLVVDNGKTVQMSLASLVKEITQNIEKSDGSLSKRIQELENAFTVVTKDVSAFKREYGSFQKSVAKRCTDMEGICGKALDISQEAVKKADTVAYWDEYFNYWELPLVGYAFTTHDAVAGETFRPEALYTGEEYYACEQEVEKGWVFSLGGCQEFVPLLDSKYLVIVDADNIVQEIVPATNLAEAGFEYEFKDNGKFYLTSKWQSNDPVFKLRHPASGVPAVTENDNGKTLQVVNGRWAAVDALTAEVGNEVAY